MLLRGSAASFCNAVDHIEVYLGARGGLLDIAGVRHSNTTPAGRAPRAADHDEEQRAAWLHRVGCCA